MRPANGTGGRDDEPMRVYGLRFTDRALAQMDSAHARFSEVSGQDAADAWKEGLLDEVSMLATLPLRYPAPAEAARFRGNVRQLLYRRSGSRVIYRLLFAVLEDGLDGSVVTILALHHGAARPITRAEAREMESEE
jgi:plasmid stabilization system protein ParE